MSKAVLPQTQHTSLVTSLLWIAAWNLATTSCIESFFFFSLLRFIATDIFSSPTLNPNYSLNVRKKEANQNVSCSIIYNRYPIEWLTEAVVGASKGFGLELNSSLLVICAVYWCNHVAWCKSFKETQQLHIRFPDIIDEWLNFYMWLISHSVVMGDVMRWAVMGWEKKLATITQIVSSRSEIQGGCVIRSSLIREISVIDIPSKKDKTASTDVYKTFKCSHPAKVNLVLLTRKHQELTSAL